ncbi:Mediator of RNA polymerase II transcription subunit 25, von Willebrand factor type A domain [Dillenia turbinata]|uniref:Mediator of RNA polymerase II transcription subunit 25 n=1 Tax=Dillenia turbinata TaxID=194707 RepID=A0AAN8ZB90_9MAGN
MTAAEKQLIVVVEGTAAMGPYWKTILLEYLEKIIRNFCGQELTTQKPSTQNFELSLVMFSAHGNYSGCLVQRSGWTRDADNFLQWLSFLPFAGGGFNDAATAEGLSEALMVRYLETD